MPKLKTVRDHCFISFLISQVQLANKSRLFELGPLSSGPLATDLAPSCPPISLFRQTWWHHCSADRALRFRLSSGQQPRQVVSLWVTDWPPLTRLTSCPPQTLLIFSPPLPSVWTIHLPFISWKTQTQPRSDANDASFVKRSLTFPGVVYVSSAGLSILPVTSPLRARCFCFHFTGEDAEGHREYVTLPRPHSCQLV